MVKTITPDGDMIEPNTDFIESWAIYTCLDYCAIGYYELEDKSCN